MTADAASAEPEISAEALARARETFQRGETLAREGQWAEALVAFLDATTHDPKLGLALYNAGVAAERLGDRAQAKRLYQSALSMQPRLVPAATNLTRLQLRAGQAADAEKELRKLVAREAEDLGLRNLYVEVLLARADLDGAFNEARRVLKSDEKNVTAMIHLSSVYMRQKKYELALMVLDNAREIARDDARVHYARAFVHLALGQKPQALESFRQAALRDDFAEAQNNLGVMLLETQDYPAAVAALEKAVSAAPDFLQARLNLGNAYRGAREYKKALEEYEKALELSGGGPDALFNLGLVHLDGELPPMTAMERLQKALSYFNKSKKAGADDPRLAKLVGETQKGIDKEKRRLEREERDRLRKAEEDRKRAAEEERVRKRESEKIDLDEK